MGAPPARRGRDDLPERLLVVRCPGWPLRALGVDGDDPVAVVAGRVVVAASTPARASGVGVGLGRREAEARCPGLVVHARDEAAERRAFEPVAAALEVFGVPVTLRAPGWAALPTRGPSRRLGGEAGLLGAVTAALAGVFPTPDGTGEAEGQGPPWWRVGVADGPFAASLAALRGVVVERGGAAAFLAPFSVERLGHEELAGVLRRLGVTTLGSFVALDPIAVRSRFGAQGAALQRLAAGGGSRLEGRPPAQAERREKGIDPPTVRLETTLFVARGLADELGRSLARRGLACSLLGVEVELSDGVRLERRWSGRGSLGPGLVAERLRAQLEAWATSRAGPRGEGPAGASVGDEGIVGIVGVRLVALEVVPDGGDQLSLWGRRGPADDERVARVVARVQGLLGPGGVLRPATDGGRGPLERARLLPFGEERPSPEGSRAARPPPWPGRLPAPSPAVVAHVPVPVDVRDAEGAPLGVDARGAVSGAPARVAVDGGPSRLVRSWSGPFPVDERWWEAGGRRRRARFQVVLADGDAYLLALERGAWTVEGRYD